MYFEFIIKYFFTTLALTLFRLRAGSCGVEEKIKIENYHFLLPSQKAHKNECGREIFHLRAVEIDEALSLKYCRNLWSIELSWRGHRRTINKMPFEDILFISLFSLHARARKVEKRRECATVSMCRIRNRANPFYVNFHLSLALTVDTDDYDAIARTSPKKKLNSKQKTAQRLELFFLKDSTTFLGWNLIFRLWR